MSATETIGSFFLTKYWWQHSSACWAVRGFANDDKKRKLNKIVDLKMTNNIKLHRLVSTLPPESVVFRSHLMMLIFLLLEVFQSLFLRHKLLLLHLDLLLLPCCHFSQLFNTQSLLEVHLTLASTGPIVHPVSHIRMIGWLSRWFTEEIWRPTFYFSENNSILRRLRARDI